MNAINGKALFSLSHSPSSYEWSEVNWELYDGEEQLRQKQCCALNNKTRNNKWQKCHEDTKHTHTIPSIKWNLTNWLDASETRVNGNGNDNAKIFKNFHADNEVKLRERTELRQRERKWDRKWNSYRKDISLFILSVLKVVLYIFSRAQNDERVLCAFHSFHCKHKH